MDVTLGATAPRPHSFKNIKDTIALNAIGRLEPLDNGANSESSSYKELNDTEQKALGRSFRAIQEPPDGIDQHDNMAFQNTWQPSKDIQLEMAGVSSPSKTKSWDPDIQTTAMIGGDKIQLIPQQTRDVTPDSTGFSNKLTMKDQKGPVGQNQKNVNAAGIQQRHVAYKGQAMIGKSMRELVGQINEQAVEMQDPIAQSGNQHDTDSTADIISTTDEKIFPCWPRMLLFLLVVLVLAGGIAAFVVIRVNEDEFKPDSGHGSIIANPITQNECTSLPLSLGDTLEIQCNFDLKHDHREKLKDAVNVVVESPNQLPASDFKVVNPTDNKEIWNIMGPRVACTSSGTYRLHFEDKNGMLLHTASVSLILKSSNLESSIQQRKVDEYGDTVFDVTCSISGDCNNYDVDFIGRRLSYTTFKHLNENKRCTTSFNDTAGYSIVCTTELEDEVIDMYSNFIGCQMTSGVTTLTSQFQLPNCSLTAVCNFNCSSKASERLSLNEGTCNRNKITRCFPATRPVWRYKLCPPPKEDCTLYEEQYECRLGWCRSHTGVLYKNEVIGGNYLCGDFERKEARTTTTSTTTSTSTSTTSTTTTTPATTSP